MQDIQFAIDKNHVLCDKIKNMDQLKILFLIELGLKTEEIIKKKIIPENKYQKITDILSNLLDEKLDGITQLTSLNTQKG
jgi:hypothetical protein